MVNDRITMQNKRDNSFQEWAEEHKVMLEAKFTYEDAKQEYEGAKASEKWSLRRYKNAVRDLRELDFAEGKR